MSFQAIRFPTQDELNAMYAAQCLADAQRAAAFKKAEQAAARNNDAEVELRQAGITPPGLRPEDISGTPKPSPIVDVMREPLPPLAPPPPPRKVKPECHCPYCGKLFAYASMGMAKMQRQRHINKTHNGETHA